MHFIFVLCFCFTNAELIKGVSEISIYNITDMITTLLDNTTNKRIEELKDKIELIYKHVQNNDNFTLALLNITKESELNQTNFFKSLNENDNYNFLTQNGTKNLYLKLKEKLNRDDVLKILDDKGLANEVVKSARKMMAKGISKYDILNEAVDKMIAEKPVDKHEFDRDNESIYWDPQAELQDLKDFHQHSGRRIFKGERTTVRYYPFMASIHVMGHFWCGGVLYWYDLVLTSAACLQLMHNNRFFRENPKVLQVRIGSNHTRISGELVDALEVYFHPSYNPKSLKNNIAVIRLRRHLYFNYHRIPKIIDISHRSTGVPATGEVLLLGWGVTKMSQKLAYEPIFLQRKFLPVYPNYFCKEIYGDKFITDTMFCAGTFTTGEGACDHDAGGPAILNGKLVGIISFGPAICGYPNAPTVFTLVGAFADWIETVNETMPGYYRGLKLTTTTTANPLVAFFENWEPIKSPLNSPDNKPVMNGKSNVDVMIGEAEDVPPPSLLERTEVFRGVRDDETDDGWSLETRE